VTAAVHLFVPGRLDQRTGGYIYDRRIVEGLRDRGVDVAVHELRGRFPDADPRTAQAAEAELSRVPDGGVAVIDGLALPALAGILWAEMRRVRIVLLVHHPLSLETGVPPAVAEATRRLEVSAFALARRFVVTSPYTADTLAADFGVPRDRIGVVVPGVDRAPPSRGSGEAAPVLLSLGMVSPRKGQDVLADALAMLKDRPWRLVCAGSLERHPEAADDLRRRIAAAGLEDRVTLAGELGGDELEAAWASADLFVLPSRYEGFGMAVAEALVRGLPVVTTTGGALATTVPSGAAVQVPPGDAGALADALAPLLADPTARAALAARARAAAAGFPSWADQAAAFAAELEHAR
jgi:glycosyltransferase involved in cell wall biosynthesis